MINGDVDLTTNLDFYHDKKNKISSNHLIPWKKEVASAIFSYEDQVTWYPTSLWTSAHVGNTYRFYDNRENLISNVAFTNNDVFTIDSISWSSLSMDSSTMRVYDNLMMSTITSIDYMDTYSYVLNYMNPSTTSTTTSIPFKYELKTKHKPSIFGEKFNKYIPSPIHYCGNCGHYTLGYCKCNRRVPSLIENRTILERFKDKVKHSVDSFFMKYLRARKDSMIRMHNRMHGWKEYESSRKIPWLRNLDSRIYEDYITDLFEEQDYSRYLTDMAWLRIQ